MEVCRWYEYPIQNESKLKEKYEAAIILGGMVHFNDEHAQLEFQGSSDRFLNVLPLYFEGKVKNILIAGGSGRMLQDEKESPHLRDYLVKIGVKEKDIIIEDESRNTFENAKNSKAIIRKKEMKGPFLLSTSASHMPRSLACFKKLELEVDPFPSDYFAAEREFNPDRLFRPKSHVLKSWNALIHEWLGYAVYFVSGYV